LDIISAIPTSNTNIAETPNNPFISSPTLRLDIFFNAVANMATAIDIPIMVVTAFVVLLYSPPILLNRNIEPINSANNVSTKFYLEDESMIDFIAEHIDTLNERLEKRGYSVRSELKTREDLKNTGGGERPMKDPTSSNTISLQSFDVRA
jgi:hypothetical protein